jgi:tripartite motif-containing protein 71
MPNSIAISNQGIIAVCDTGNHRVQLFENDGTFKIQFNTNLNMPSGVAFTYNGQYLAISDTGNHRIQIRKNTGEIVKHIGQYGDQPGSLKLPAGITITKTNLIFVCDAQNNRVQVFGINGEFLKIFGENDLLLPVSICVLQTGEIFVSDSKKGSIQCFRLYKVFNTEHKIIGTTSLKFFEKKTSILISVYGVFVDKNGTMIVSHPYSNTISIFKNFNYHENYREKTIFYDYKNMLTNSNIKEDVYIKLIEY